MSETLSVEVRACRWIVSGDTGTSSRTIWGVMMNGGHDDDSVPYDSSDFGRCFRLLERIPEWRPRLLEVAKEHPRWRRLVAAWPQMEDLYRDGKHEELSRRIGVLVGFGRAHRLIKRRARSS